MAPKRLGPGGRLRNSGFRPKSSLCGSDCICFYSSKAGRKDGTPRETAGKKNVNEEEPETERVNSMNSGPEGSSGSSLQTL